MTRKHFERIAQVFRVNKQCYNEQRRVHEALIDDMCIELKSINPRFDEQKFRAACNG